MIEISTLGLLASVSVGMGWDGGQALLTIVVMIYFFMDWRLTIPFALWASGLYFLGRAASPALLWSLMIFGWVIQFVGHYRFEGKSPAFFKNLKHLLVGPLWAFTHMIDYPEPESEPRS